MRIRFLGTRGNTDCRSRRHRWHSATLLCDENSRIMLDCGADWAARLRPVAPTAIVITHAHPDHAWGLKEGAPCPVYATREGWNSIDSPAAERRVIAPREPIRIGHLIFEAFPVVHSIRCPAVGYRISAAEGRLFYVPDVVAIPDRAAALADVNLYIGDGATLTRPMIRRSGSTLFGHTPIRTQLGWCEKEGVGHAIFTHCGTEIVSGDGRKITALVRAMGRARGVIAQLAHDGFEFVLPEYAPSKRDAWASMPEDPAEALNISRGIGRRCG